MCARPLYIVAIVRKPSGAVGWSRLVLPSFLRILLERRFEVGPKSVRFGEGRPISRKHDLPLGTRNPCFHPLREDVAGLGLVTGALSPSRPCYPTH
jgi:hypothetical protein